jgi:hypothetical protein
MPIDASVAELLTAQLFVLVQEAPDPIFFYINSTGIAVGGEVMGRLFEEGGRMMGKGTDSRMEPGSSQEQDRRGAIACGVGMQHVGG